MAGHWQTMFLLIQLDTQQAIAGVFDNNVVHVVHEQADLPHQEQ